MNDVVKPWDELNELLIQPIAVEPNLSDITRQAANLAVAIKHQADIRRPAGIDVASFRSEVDANSHSNRMMSDVADAAKHGKLKNAARNNSLFVAAHFEYDPNRGFRFIRNAVAVEHSSAGKFDFMKASLEAIEYWMHHLNFQLHRPLVIAEAPAIFYDTARLIYDPKFCIKMECTRFNFFSRDEAGAYIPVDPPSVPIEIQSR